MSRSQRHLEQIYGKISRDDRYKQPAFKKKGSAGDTAPTNITLTPATITAASAIGTVVGALSATDDNTTKGRYSYLITNDESGHWGLKINGNGNQYQVVKKGAVTAGARSATIQVTDDAGNTFSKAVTITVT